MNNDELKKKIADIIYHTGCTGACCECDYSKHSDADTYCKAMLKASALIAAGIGDVKKAERELFVFKNELASVIHRAEVYERALYNVAISDTEYQNAIKQAEKELSEERE